MPSTPLAHRLRERLRAGTKGSPPPNVTEFYSTFFQVLLALASFSLRKKLKPRTPNPDSKIAQGITNNLVPTGSFLSS